MVALDSRIAPCYSTDMSKVKIVGNSYQNVSITVDGVEIPCMKADIHISDNAGIVATLTVPAELDISTLNMV